MKFSTESLIASNISDFVVEYKRHDFKEEFVNFQIFVSCDIRYFEHHAKRFLASVNCNSPGCKVIIHVYDPNEEILNEICELQKNFRSIDIVLLAEKSLADAFEENRKPGYFVNQRFIVLHDYLKKYPKQTFFTDVDAIIHRDLLALHIEHAKSDIAIFLRPNRDDKHNVLGGAIRVSGSDESIKFIGSVATLIAAKISALESAWYFDQEVLWQCLIDYNDRIIISHLGQKYVDWAFLDGSVVWSAKGDRKDTNIKYIDYGIKISKDLKTPKKVAILAPRIDLPFKASINPTPEIMESNIRNKIRIYWMYVARIVTDALNKNGVPAELIVRPLWEFTDKYLAGLEHETIYMPHRSHFQIKDRRAIFYMQEIYPEFFTFNSMGWAASSTKYKSFEYVNQKISIDAQRFIHQVQQEKMSKFSQELPNSPYEFDIFFPLQIPHDQVLQYHSKYSLKEIVEYVLVWSKVNKIKILFKEHPMNSTEKPYIDWSLGDKTYYEVTKAGNIHDYIERSKCVMVANSGVGFEAMFYYKPIITFANAIYDIVTYNCDIQKDDLNQIYRHALNQDIKIRRIEYEKFIDWYLFSDGNFLNQKILDLNLDKYKIKGYHNHYFEEINTILNPPVPKDGNAIMRSKNNTLDQKIATSSKPDTWIEQKIVNGKPVRFIENRKSDKLLIVLSPRNQDYFMATKRFVKDPKINVCFLFDSDNSYYMENNEGKEYLDTFKILMKPYKNCNVTILGTSSSGYAAIYFGLNLNTNVIANVPQLNLDIVRNNKEPKWDGLRKDISILPKLPNLTDLLSEHKQDTKILIVHGKAQLDIETIDNLKQKINKEVLPKKGIWILERNIKEHEWLLGRSAASIYRMMKFLDKRRFEVH